MPDWVLPVLTVIVSSGGLITALATWQRDKRKGPVEAQTAQVADAVALSNAAAGLVKLNDERQEKQDSKIDAQDRKIEGLTSEVSGLRHEVNRWGYWYSDLTYRWPYHRQQDKPPPPPTALAESSPTPPPPNKE